MLIVLGIISGRNPGYLLEFVQVAERVQAFSGPFTIQWSLGLFLCVYGVRRVSLWKFIGWFIYFLLRRPQHQSALATSWDSDPCVVSYVQDSLLLSAKCHPNLSHCVAVLILDICAASFAKPSLVRAGCMVQSCELISVFHLEPRGSFL